MLRFTILTICFVALLTEALHAQSCASRRYLDEVFPAAQVTQDIQFGTADPYGLATSQDLFLDFYEPQGDSILKRPLIVYAFGGGYLIGDKRQPDIPAFCTHYAKQGYAVVSIDYRIGFNVISSGSAIRAVYRGLQDVRAAVRFMCENRNIYKIDTSSIILTGSSAGCISGITSSYFTDADRPSDTYGIIGEPEDLGCSDCSGNALFGRHIPKPLAILNRWGAILDTTYIDNSAHDNVPMISFHGTNDNAVPYVSGNPFSYPVFPTVMGSSLIHKRLSHLNIYNQLVPLTGAGHEPELLNPDWDDTIYKYSAPFLYELLRPHITSISGGTRFCVGDTQTFSVPYKAGSVYCWDYDTAVSLLVQGSNYIKLAFNNPGTYYIGVFEKNDLQAVSARNEIRVSVLPRPIASFSFSSSELSVSFFDSSRNCRSVSWNFGDVSFSTAPNPSHVYTDTGVYQVLLTAGNGVCQDTERISVPVYKCPLGNISFSEVAPQTIYFLSNASYSNSYLWNFADGNTDTNKNAFHRFAPGDYRVSLIISNGHGCRDTLYQDIHIGFANSILESETGEWLVYPNPAKDILYVQAKTIGPYSLTLTDLSGRICISANAHETPLKIDVANLAGGTYIVTIRHNGSTLQSRIVIER